MDLGTKQLIHKKNLFWYRRNIVPASRRPHPSTFCSLAVLLRDFALTPEFLLHFQLLEPVGSGCFQAPYTLLA
jgi:hypothetical protein